MDSILLNLKALLSQEFQFLRKNKIPKKEIVVVPESPFNCESIHYKDIDEIVKFLKPKVRLDELQPKIGIICGSGLGGLADLISDAQVIEYKNIPHFPVSTVAGHHGALVFGKLQNVSVVCMKGRFHPYEGYSLATCTIPIRVMKMLGVQTLIVTNAAGGLNATFEVADIMIIKDHIFFPGFAGNNPLRGWNEPRFGPRFPAMNNCYDRRLIKVVEEAVERLEMTKYTKKGVYAMLGGPNYETVAEANFLRHCGVDAVGMSTVHEVLAAHHSGLHVLGFSLITNKIITDYDTEEQANHEEVLAAAKSRAQDFENLIREVVSRIGDIDDHNEKTNLNDNSK